MDIEISGNELSVEEKSSSRYAHAGWSKTATFECMCGSDDVSVDVTGDSITVTCHSCPNWWSSHRADVVGQYMSGEPYFDEPYTFEIDTIQYIL